MSKYEVVTAHCVHTMLLQHTAFIARVSILAAKRFREEFAGVLKRLSENLLQFPLNDSIKTPETANETLPRDTLSPSTASLTECPK